MDALPYDLLQRVFDELEFRDKLMFIMTSRWIYHMGLVIEDVEMSHRLTDEILRQPKYRFLRRLDAKGNRNITTVNHLVYLKELDAGYGGIQDLMTVIHVASLVRGSKAVSPSRS